MVLGSHVGLHALAMVCTAAPDVHTGSVGTNKRERFDILVIAQEVDSLKKEL